MTPRRSVRVSWMVSAVCVWTCSSSAFQNTPMPTTTRAYPRPMDSRRHVSVSVLLPLLCQRSLQESRLGLGAVGISRTGGDEDDKNILRTAGESGTARSNSRGTATKLRTVSRSDKSTPGVRPRVSTLTPPGQRVDAGNYPGRTLDVPGTWRAQTQEISMLDDAQQLWGLPHIELSNSGRQQHGVSSFGKSLLKGLPQLGERNGAMMSSGSADEIVEKANDAKGFPQRWRGEGEAAYEENSAIRYLDGWAETFPAVVDASNGSLPLLPLAPAPTPAHTLLPSSASLVCYCLWLCSALPWATVFFQRLLMPSSQQMRLIMLQNNCHSRTHILNHTHYLSLTHLVLQWRPIAYPHSVSLWNKARAWCSDCNHGSCREHVAVQTHPFLDRLCETRKPLRLAKRGGSGRRHGRCRGYSPGWCRSCACIRVRAHERDPSLSLSRPCSLSLTHCPLCDMRACYMSLAAPRCETFKIVGFVPLLLHKCSRACDVK